MTPPVQRDADGVRYRGVTSQEMALKTCHKCARGKVNHAVYDAAGEIDYFACPKHGNAEGGELPLPGATPLTKAPAKVKAERAEPESKPTAVHRTCTVYRCGKCNHTWADVPLGTSFKGPCPKCGRDVCAVCGEGTVDVNLVEGPGANSGYVMFTLPTGLVPDAIYVRDVATIAAKKT